MSSIEQATSNDWWRKVAIIRNVWSLSQYDRGLLDNYFILYTTAEKLKKNYIESPLSNSLVYNGREYDVEFVDKHCRIKSGDELVLISFRQSSRLDTNVALVKFPVRRIWNDIRSKFGELK